MLRTGGQTATRTSSPLPTFGRGTRAWRRIVGFRLSNFGGNPKHERLDPALELVLRDHEDLKIQACPTEGIGRAAARGVAVFVSSSLMTTQGSCRRSFFRRETSGKEKGWPPAMYFDKPGRSLWRGAFRSPGRCAAPLRMWRNLSSSR